MDKPDANCNENKPIINGIISVIWRDIAAEGSFGSPEEGGVISLDCNQVVATTRTGKIYSGSGWPRLSHRNSFCSGTRLARPGISSRCCKSRNCKGVVAIEWLIAPYRPIRMGN